MSKIRKIELLAPAKNLECGMEAINHGADAVYIGAPMFGARASAGNTVEDIKTLAEHAHLFGAKVYVAINTILSDEDIIEAEKLIWELYETAKVDALIIQDMGITMLNLPPIPLHASTQVDNRDVEKITFLEKAGFQQIVLARELNLEEIRTIANETTVPLEAFVHGALCVCFSGQCYLSQALSNRSANKGSCAQYCRMPYTLEDASGEEIISKKHLLSMKDLNLSDSLEELIDAGVSSLKIEGRMKDITYVKNVVAYYRQKLDHILIQHPEYKKASSGECKYAFEPKLDKSFNRGFTSYFLHNRSEHMWSLHSPKSVGEYIGDVVEVSNRYIRINSNKTLNNGDGLCYLNDKEELEGVRINRVEGDKVFLASEHTLKRNTLIYRNFDNEFDKLLSKKTAERRISVSITLDEHPAGFSLSATDEDGNTTTLHFDQSKDIAQKSQSDNIHNNLSKTGNTIFDIKSIYINWCQDWFIPASVISEWRRRLMESLLEIRKANWKQVKIMHTQTTHAFPTPQLTYLGNVMNDKSKQFYVQHQAQVTQSAFEKQAQKNVALMFTRHCIKQSIGFCPKEQKDKHPYQEPFYITYSKTRLRLNFDCKKCEMQIYHDR